MKIEAVRLSKTYGSGEAAVQALRPCSFSLESGERAAIVGASGSGKTTLLQLLGALETPTDGNVLYDGQPLMGGDEETSRFRLRHIGFVFQSYQLIPELTALENVLLPCLLRGKKAEKSGTLPRCSGGCGSRIGRTACRRSCQAGSSSAPPSRGRLPTGRSFCSATSRRETSTRKIPCWCSSCWRSFSRSSA